MIFVDPFAVSSAFASFLLAAALVVQATRLGMREAPRTVLALAGFLVLSGAAWLIEPALGHRSHLVQLLNSAMTIALVLLSLRARVIVRALTDARRRASQGRREYERALRDYERLMAHRIANPLTVIAGTAQTLRDVDLPAHERDELLGLIVDAAKRLEATSSRPAVESVEERDLRPAPGFQHRSQLQEG